MTDVAPDFYRREAGGLRSLNTGLLRSGPPPVVVDGFRLGVDEPSLTTAGVRDTSILARHDGNLIVTAAGTVVRNLDVWGTIIVRAADVLVENCIARGPATTTGANSCINAEDPAAAGFAARRVSAIPQTPWYTRDAFRVRAGATVDRCYARDVVDGVGVFGDDVAVLGCLFEDFGYWTPNPTQPTDNQPHNDAVQVQAGRRVRIVGNSFRGFYGAAGTHQPANQGGPTPSGWPNPSFAWVLLSANVGPISDLTVTDNWVRGFDIPMNTGSASVSGVNLGTWQRNRFDRTSRAAGGVLGGWTLAKRADQTADFGVGTPNRNTYLDGGDVTIRSAG